MKMRFNLVLFSVLLFVSICGCSDSSNDFEENGSGHSLITNGLGFDVALFVDDVSADNFIGAIKSGKTDHRLDIPDNGYLVGLKAVRYEEYTNNKDCLCELKPVSSVIAFPSDRDKSFEINSNKLSGDDELTIFNKSVYYLYVYESSLEEITLGIVKPSSITTLFVKEGAYNLKFVKLSPIRDGNKHITGVKSEYKPDLSDLVEVVKDEIAVITVNYID